MDEVGLGFRVPREVFLAAAVEVAGVMLRVDTATSGNDDRLKSARRKWNCNSCYQMPAEPA